MKKNLFFLLLMFNISYALELSTSDKWVLKVAVVDMNRVLKESEKAKKINVEIQLFKENKKLQIVPLENEINDFFKKRIELINEIEQLKRQSNIEENYKQNFSTMSQRQDILKIIEKKHENLEELNKVIEEKKRVLEQKQLEIEEETKNLIKKYEVQLYKEVYNIIKELAEKENINIVIDKSGILYGVSGIDITDKVINLLK